MASDPVKVPLRGGQLKHLLSLQQTIRDTQLAFEACVVGFAREAEVPDGANYSVTPVLDGPEPHILLTPAEPAPDKPRKG